MSKGEPINKAGYYLLWILVLLTSGMLLSLLCVAEIGKGGWECTQWSEPTCRVTCMEGTEFTTSQFNCYEGIITKCSGDVNWHKEEKKCLKKTWVKIK